VASTTSHEQQRRTASRAFNGRSHCEEVFILAWNHPPATAHNYRSKLVNIEASPNVLFFGFRQFPRHPTPLGPLYSRIENRVHLSQYQMSAVLRYNSTHSVNV
jgi:hypothetical protein